MFDVDFDFNSDVGFIFDVNFDLCLFDIEFRGPDSISMFDIRF